MYSSVFQKKWVVLEGLKTERLEVKLNYKYNLIQHIYQMADRKLKKNCVFPSSMKNKLDSHDGYTCSQLTVMESILRL
jgi:hypothetical protein